MKSRRLTISNVIPPKINCNLAQICVSEKMQKSRKFECSRQNSEDSFPPYLCHITILSAKFKTSAGYFSEGVIMKQTARIFGGPDAI